MGDAGQGPDRSRRRFWWQALGSDRVRAQRRQAADRLYVGLVNQARSPSLFRDLRVPDTPEGRFEMVALHVALALRRLRREGEAGQALAQELFDLMIEDFDESLRQIGVGDLSVGKYVKRLAGNVYARIAALDQAFDQGDQAALGRMIVTNVYHGAPTPSEHQVDGLAGLLRRTEMSMAEADGRLLLEGQLHLTPPATTAVGAA